MCGYRWLLRDGLGGTGGTGGTMRTCFLAVGSMESGKLPLTINTLRFAHKCRQARVWVGVPEREEEHFDQLTDQSALLSSAAALTGGSAVVEQRASVHRRSEPPPYTPNPPGSPNAGPRSTSLLAASQTISVQLGPVSDSDSDESESASPPALGAEHPEPTPILAIAATPPPRSASAGAEGEGGSSVGAPSSSEPAGERTQEVEEVKQKLALVHLRLGDLENLGAESPPQLEASEGWEQLQSAHAHMVLLEARLAELTEMAGGSPNAAQ